MSPANFAAEALASLTDAQISFLQALPKAELHTHLNGSIPLPILQELAHAFLDKSSVNGSGGVSAVSESVKAGIERLELGVELNEIHDFFSLFPAIYALTSTPQALRTVTLAILEAFLDGLKPQCTYLELRTTPRETPAMTRREYLEAVLAEMEKFDPEGRRVNLIVSVDRRMSEGVVDEIMDLAIALRDEGRRVVGIDLCGDPLAGDMYGFSKHFRRAKAAGFGITLHIAETPDSPASETLHFLESFAPTRLGHATFLDEEAMKIVFDRDIPVEICLSSNLLCKTVKTLDDHHIRHYLQQNHAIAICTDDTLPFRTDLLSEYALLLAKPPLGLGLSQEEVQEIANMSLSCRFI
ncbi:hypothetical protein JAAARDRAFT_174899 [Jaapia argillacea MUCL 33604]|uniref:Adenosine deaminase domain-containing protein n=1 Tax=Jaapia argillacea MUCL 33604 TaxID=933084 RepID=A0A067QAB6_9AGAM|nr:hypothetical protein JAAARDRAFT_174899 [Jaapia argillacea MUCL 33604]